MSKRPELPRRDVVSCRSALLALFVALHGGACAQTLSGSLTPYEHPQYAGVDAHFLISGAQIGGQSVWDGTIVILCTDLAAISIDEDSPIYPLTLGGSYPPLSKGVADQLDVWGRYGARDEALATAQAMWLVDSFYESYFVSPPAAETHARQYAFQNAIWEIFGDGGTGSALDFSSGNIIRSKFGPVGSSPAPELWSHMNILIDAVNNSGVSAAYQPSHQPFTALDARAGYQDYLALSLSPSLMLVPEPAGGALLLISGVILLGHRRRCVAG